MTEYSDNSAHEACESFSGPFKTRLGATVSTVIGLFKTEVIRPRGPWRSFDVVEYATLEWVDGQQPPVSGVDRATSRQPRRKQTNMRPLRSPGWPRSS